jgi:hypothetical protein
VLAASLFVVTDAASASTQAPSFTRSDYQQLGKDHVLADFNGDGRLGVAGIGAFTVAGNAAVTASVQ